MCEVQLEVLAMACIALLLRQRSFFVFFVFVVFGSGCVCYGAAQ
jgi:hypothetical protein